MNTPRIPFLVHGSGNSSSVRGRTTPRPVARRRPRQAMAEVELAWPEDEVSPLAGDPPRPAPHPRPVAVALCGALVGFVVGLVPHWASATPDPTAAPSPVPGPAVDSTDPLPGVRDFRRGSPGVVGASPGLTVSPSEPASACFALTFADPGVARAAVTAGSDGRCQPGTSERAMCAEQLARHHRTSWAAARLACESPGGTRGDPTRFFAAPHPW